VINDELGAEELELERIKQRAKDHNPDDIKKTQRIIGQGNMKASKDEFSYFKKDSKEKTSKAVIKVSKNDEEELDLFN